jgi:hypothetical protein
MAHPLAQQIVEEANALHRAAVSKATYTVYLCMYTKDDDGAVYGYHDEIQARMPLCLTPLGSHLYIKWLDMRFRVHRSDAVTYGDTIELVTSSWSSSLYEHLSDHGQPLEQAVGRIYMTHQDKEVNRYVDFDVSNSKEAATAIRLYLAPLRHLAPPPQV